jgi:hypothetical protein
MSLLPVFTVVLAAFAEKSPSLEARQRAAQVRASLLTKDWRWVDDIPEKIDRMMLLAGLSEWVRKAETLESLRFRLESFADLCHSRRDRGLDGAFSYTHMWLCEAGSFEAAHQGVPAWGFFGEEHEDLYTPEMDKGLFPFWSWDTQGNPPWRVLQQVWEEIPGSRYGLERYRIREMYVPEDPVLVRDQKFTKKI